MSKLRRRKTPSQKGAQEMSSENKKTVRLEGTEINTLKSSKIFQKAIENAKKHHIKLVPGIENSGGGNCSYESVILNVNERECFKVGFVMSPDFYRRVWNVDLMNKILDGRVPWNPGMSRTEIIEGFQELMESGVYERNFFGDMMMAGIACGVRKRILIFNTHEMTPHDPISVIDPSHYGGSVDSDIPVVLAYDLVHYESLHTVDNDDIEETIKLVRCYIAEPSTYKQDYGFTRKDMGNLVSPSSTADVACRTANVRSLGVSPTKDKEYEVAECFKFEGISFRELNNGNIICGVCQVECMRLVVHLNESLKCSDVFKMNEFKAEYSKFRHAESQRKKRKSDIDDVSEPPSKDFRTNDANLQKKIKILKTAKEMNPDVYQKKEKKSK